MALGPEELSDALAGGPVGPPRRRGRRSPGSERLSGGASRETFAFDLVLARRRASSADPPARPARWNARRDRAWRCEAALVRIAAGRGVPVPGVVAADGDPDVGGGVDLGGAVDRRRSGAGGDAGPPHPAGRRVRGSPAPAGRPVRRRRSPRSTGSHWPRRLALTGGDPVDQQRTTLDQLGQPHPAIELGLRWLEAQPAAGSAGHRGPRRLPQRQPGGRSRRPAGGARLGARPLRRPDRGPRLVLRAGVALRVERSRRAGSVAARSCSPRTRRRAGVRSIRAELHWWEVLGTLKWGVICVMQASAHLIGAVPLGRAGRHRPPGLRDRARPDGAAAVIEVPP